MNEIAIRIQSDPEIINGVNTILTSASDARPVRVETDEEGGIGADFDLETVATLVAVVSTLFFDGPIVPQLLQLFKKKPGSRIMFESPRQTITIEVNKDLDLETLTKALKALEIP